MKRQIAYFIVIFVGFLALIGHFINYAPLNNFIDNDATQWFDIISGFAAFLGVISLLNLHIKKIIYKRPNWQYSIITTLSFLIMLFFGFIYIGIDVPRGAHLKAEGSAFYWMFNNIYLPLASSMFALLAFFVASASYRAFKIRNFEATLLLISGVLLMLGRVPIGQIIPWWFSVELYILILFAVIAGLFSNKRTLVLFMVFSMVTFPVLIYSFDLTALKLFSIPDGTGVDF